MGLMAVYVPALVAANLLPVGPPAVLVPSPLAWTNQAPPLFIQSQAFWAGGIVSAQARENIIALNFPGRGPDMMIVSTHVFSEMFLPGVGIAVIQGTTAASASWKVIAAPFPPAAGFPAYAPGAGSAIVWGAVALQVMERHGDARRHASRGYAPIRQAVSSPVSCGRAIGRALACGAAIRLFPSAASCSPRCPG